MHNGTNEHGTVFVTGGSGHLGANLIRRLLREGQAVRALQLPGSDNSALDGLDIERTSGDLRDLDGLQRAVRGCRRVYHCAARVSTVAGGEREIYDCNVIGTKNLLRAAMAAGVERVVVTGSLSAVGHQPDRPSDEEVPFYPFEDHLPYTHTKTLVEHECWKAAAAGLPVVVATSTAILGPNDFKPSRMGQVLCDFANRKLLAYIPGGFTFVAAHDIVEGHLLCMERGRSGQKYIFATQFLTMDEIMAMFEEITGKKRPLLRLRPEIMGPIARITTFVKERLVPGAPQGLTPAAVRLLTLQRRTDTRKARTELGFQPTSIRRSVEEAYEFFVQRGRIRGNPRRTFVAPTRGARPGAEVQA